MSGKGTVAWSMETTLHIQSYAWLQAEGATDAEVSLLQPCYPVSRKDQEAI